MSTHEAVLLGGARTSSSVRCGSNSGARVLCMVSYTDKVWTLVRCGKVWTRCVPSILHLVILILDNVVVVFNAFFLFLLLVITPVNI